MEKIDELKKTIDDISRKLSPNDKDKADDLSKQILSIGLRAIFG